MVALSPPPPLFSVNGWYSEDPIPLSYDHQDYIGRRESETLESFLNFSTSDHQTTQVVEFEWATPSSTAISTGDPKMVKKLNHNASERDRRKKLNTLYYSLRSLLPDADQMKKLSIPATVSLVVKYIPELQQQVERLIQKKEEILSSIGTQGPEFHQENLTKNKEIHQEKQPKSIAMSSLSSVSASRVDDREVVVQISTSKLHMTPLSEILLNLEEDGLLLLNASSFESLEGKVFYNLHLQFERTQGLECEILSEKLMSLYDKREELFPY